MSGVLAFPNRPPVIRLDYEYLIVSGMPFGSIQVPGANSVRFTFLTPDRRTANDICTVHHDGTGEAVEAIARAIVGTLKVLVEQGAVTAEPRSGMPGVTDAPEGA